jgi:metal-sulfur cluster biosynthetic enzyme
LTVLKKPLSTGQLEAGVLELLDELELLELLVDVVALGLVLVDAAGALEELESEIPEPARESVR